MQMDVRQLVGSTSQNQNTIGKLLYYSLPKLLLPMETFNELCLQYHFPYRRAEAPSPANAFRAATGDFKKRYDIARPDGSVTPVKLYLRDNKREDGDIISRELVRECLDVTTNRYTKLANICYDKRLDAISCNNIVYDSDVDMQAVFCGIQELFYTYRASINNTHLSTLLGHYLADIQAVGINVKCNMYFIPNEFASRVSLLEDFIMACYEANEVEGIVTTANSLYVENVEKQRAAMARECQIDMKKTIAEYQQQITRLLALGATSEKVVARLGQRIESLRQKEMLYQNLLNTDLAETHAALSDLDFQFRQVQYQAQQAQAA